MKKTQEPILISTPLTDLIEQKPQQAEYPPLLKHWLIKHLSLELCFRTSKGKGHIEYEDRVSVKEFGDSLRLMVLDGVSHKECAPDSFMFVETVLHDLEKSVGQSLVLSLQSADVALAQYNNRNLCWTGSTALVADMSVKADKERVFVSSASVGDSTAAIWSRTSWWSKKKSLQQLHKPHTKANGELAECLGLGGRRQHAENGDILPMMIDLKENIILQAGDILILASDGCIPTVDFDWGGAEKLLRMLDVGFGLDVLTEAFFKEALLQGSEDDMTILMVRFLPPVKRG